MRLFRWIFVVSLLLVSSGVRAQTRLTRNGKPAARIVVAQQTAADLTAAQLLQRFVRESTGATLPLLHDVTPRKGNILIGASDTAGLAEDGFRLRTQDGVLRISSGGDKGAVYGVMTLLERYLGLDYFAAGVYDLDRNPTVTLPAMDFAENPAFRYRQSQGYGMAQDSVYRLALRLEEPRDIFAGGLWVHTFNSRRRSTARSIPNTTRSSTANDVPAAPANGVSPTTNSSNWWRRKSIRSSGPTPA